MLATLARKIIREPLVHFVALALGLFVLYQTINPQAGRQDDGEIFVTRSDLLTYMQYRAKTFDSEHFEQIYESLSEEERGRLIEEYVRQEAMYREALALQLNKNDYVAKQRLIQQLEFIAQDFFDNGVSLPDGQLEAYFEAHASNYVEPAKLTFTHVFFSSALHGPAEADAFAMQELNILNAGPTPFHEAMRHGDRALFNVNYVQKDIEIVASHFSPEMADALFELEPSDTVWRGPFQSAYGSHLVLLIDNMPARTPALSEIRGRVHADALAELKRERLREAVNDITASYSVRLSDDLALSAEDSSS